MALRKKNPADAAGFYSTAYCTWWILIFFKNSTGSVVLAINSDVRSRAVLSEIPRSLDTNSYSAAISISSCVLRMVKKYVNTKARRSSAACRSSRPWLAIHLLASSFFNSKWYVFGTYSKAAPVMRSVVLKSQKILRRARPSYFFSRGIV